MRIVHTADWHIGQFRGPIVNGKNARFTDISNRLSELVDEISSTNSDLVIIAGDIFNQAEIQAKRASEEELLAANTIIEISKHATDVIVLRGTPNHDGAGQFEVLKGILKSYKHIHVVTEPTVISVAGADVACIPGFDKAAFRAKFPGLSAEEENIAWTKEIGSIVMGLRALCTAHPAILTAHYTVPGCNMESGQTSFFSNFEPVIPREVLQTADFDAVMLGHIHRPQQIAGLRSVFYSGSVDQLNFNDEGQERGYYIHYFDEFKDRTKDNAIFSRLTPREHLTIKWTDDDVSKYLLEGKKVLPQHGLIDKIVRIQYSCTDEHKKALNIPQLEADLESLGAFFVSEISAENIIEVNNRGLLAEEADPVENLRKWLDEKCVPDSKEISDLGQPIIETAVAMQTKNHIQGTFRPVSIHVKNYRNYVEENFDFTNISFCTINGVNGAGKSSLFMDAIIDALFEEPREGDLKGWIRATPDAKSGMIEFIFDIGDHRYRVVRTRVKSGKATLGFSELVDGEWENRGGERIQQTQDAIVDTIGMDSMTFRSCALIMQDQYGLFLQAKKEDRMTILGNLLGLGVYGTMEGMAVQKRVESRRALADAQTAVSLKENEKAKYDDPGKALEDIESQIASKSAIRNNLTEEKKQADADLQKRDLLESQMKEAHESLDSIGTTLSGINSDIHGQKSAIDSITSKLDQAPEIRSKADLYRKKSEEQKELDPVIEHVKALREKLKEKTVAHDEAQEKLKAAAGKEESLRSQLENLNGQLKDSHPDELKGIDEARANLQTVREKQKKVEGIKNTIEGAKANFNIVAANINGTIKRNEAELDRCRKQRDYMEHSGCIDFGKAKCKFLSSAIEDVEKIPGLEEAISDSKDELKAEEADLNDCIKEFERQITETGFTDQELTDAENRVRQLEQYEALERQNASLRTQIASLTAQITETVKSIAELTETEIKASDALTDISTEISSLSGKESKSEQLAWELKELEPFVQKETELPLLEQQLKFAEDKLNTLETSRDSKIKESEKLEERLMKLEEDQKAYDGCEKAAKYFDTALTAVTDEINQLMIRKGTLTEQANRVRTLEEEIADLKKQTDDQALILHRYEILVKAFSQDGVPHQIVRNIIPHIEQTANAILSSMTGGTMGVSFVLDKLIKGSGNEKATLDVMIEEYGKTTLPYASKSGGEKVKASLAVILALSEIKSSSAGLSMGMLFIDEPPFLDDDGTQAYVDALETIRKRYKDTKIMAITHDAAMKARFDQSITIVKDEGGSRVVYD